MRLTLDEKRVYDAIVNDVCASECPEYSNLVMFVHKLLMNKVKNWCNSGNLLRGGRHEEDIMQLVQIRIIKTCEDSFFKPVDGKTDKTCEEFKAWCTVVAKNCFISYYNKQNKKKEVKFNPDLKSNGGNDNYYDDGLLDTEKESEQKKNLNDCFLVVMDLKSSPHIVLTWLALSLIMMRFDVKKIEATHLLAEKFSELTLDKMYGIVFSMMEAYDWICVSEEQKELQRKKLRALDKDSGKEIGLMKYSDFYMKKGPEMSISDWVNRVNSQIKKQIEVDE